MSHGKSAILAEGLVKRFGKTEALRGLDLHVEEGTVLGLLGPNGAGKTTAVRIFATLLPPDAGRATVAGLDVVAQSDQLRSLIGLTGQYAAVDEYLTGRENLEMVARLYHLARGDTVYQVLRQTTNGHDTALADQVAASPMENHWTQRAQAAIVRAGRGPTERGESAPGARTQVHMPVPAGHGASNRGKALYDLQSSVQFHVP